MVKPLFWIGSSHDDLKEFPDEVQDEFGFALYQAQMGAKHVKAKPLKGYGGASVLEVVENHVGDTYRAVYTVKFSGAIYALHCFQKKSKQGRATPKHEIELVDQRLKAALAHYEEWKKRL